MNTSEMDAFASLPAANIIQRAKACATITCEGCRFWQPYKGPDDPRGTCRHRAPRAQDRAGWGVFPITTRDDWCGEAQPVTPDVSEVTTHDSRAAEWLRG